jgi:hypothetical protein
MILNNGFYKSVINKLIDEEIKKIHSEKYKYIGKKYGQSRRVNPP